MTSVPHRDMQSIGALADRDPADRGLRGASADPSSSSSSDIAAASYSQPTWITILLSARLSSIRAEARVGVIAPTNCRPRQMSSHARHNGRPMRIRCKGTGPAGSA